MYKSTFKTLSCSAFFLSNSLLAANLTVLNHNFEFDAIPPSPGYTTSITGWVNSGLGIVGVTAPIISESHYNNIGGRAQVGFLDHGGRISQTMNTSLVNDETYTLSFDIGQHLSQSSPNFVVRVKAKGQTLAQLQNDTFTIPSGDWATYSLQFTATPDMPIGEPVVIEFQNLANTSGHQVDIDNITFDIAGTGTDLPGDNLGPFTMIMEDTTLLVPNQYPNINAALRYLDDKQIKVGKTVTIQVTDCSNQVYTESINVAHPNGDAIHISGNTQNPLNCTIQFNNSNGFKAENGNKIGLIDGFNIVGDTTTDTSGVLAYNGSTINLGQNVIVSRFTNGIIANRSSTVNADYTESHYNVRAGYLATSNSYIKANNCSTSNNENGYFAFFNSSISAENSEATNNAYSGFRSVNKSTLWAANSLAISNGHDGFFAWANSHISADNSRSENNSRAGYYAAITSLITVPGTLSKDNGSTYNPSPGAEGNTGSWIYKN